MEISQCASILNSVFKNNPGQEIVSQPNPRNIQQNAVNPIRTKFSFGLASEFQAAGNRDGHDCEYISHVNNTLYRRTLLCRNYHKTAMEQ